MASKPAVAVTVVHCPAARQVVEVALQLPRGSTVLDAIRASGCLQGLSDTDVDALQISLGGRKSNPGHVLRDGERVELLRALKVDPKIARRERFAKQGARSTGLFAKLRDGGKAGY